MPIFEIESPTGEILEIEGDNVPNSEQIKNIFSKYSASPKSDGPVDIGSNVLSTLEIDRDIAEDKIRPERLSPLSLVPKMVSGAGKELKEFGETISSLSKAAGGSFPEIISTAIDPRSTAKLAKQISSKGPEFVRDVVLSFGESVGYKPDRGFDVDVALTKLEDRPIETILDLLLVKGIGKKAISYAAKKGSKVASKKLMKDKKTLHKILSKENIYKRQDSILNKMDIDSPEAALIKTSDSIKGVPPKQLDNPNYSIKLGKIFQNQLSKLERAERSKLNRELSKIKDVEVDNKVLLDKIKTSFNNNDLLDNTIKSDKLSDLIYKDYNKTSVRNIINSLESGDKFNISKIKDRMNVLDQKINYNKVNPDQEGLHLLRTELRSILGEAAEKNNSAYNDVAAKVHRRLNSIKKDSEKISKIGGGEKLGKRFIDTDDQVNEIKNILKQSDTKIGTEALATIDKLQGWHKWNNFFNQNQAPSFIPAFVSAGSIPIPVGSLFTGPKKALIKAKMKAKDLPITKKKLKGVSAAILKTPEDRE